MGERFVIDRMFDIAVDVWRGLFVGFTFLFVSTLIVETISKIVGGKK